MIVLSYIIALSERKQQTHETANDETGTNRVENSRAAVITSRYLAVVSQHARDCYGQIVQRPAADASRKFRFITHGSRRYRRTTLYVSAACSRQYEFTT